VALALIAFVRSCARASKPWWTTTAPVFWLFFLLTGLALFVLRWREPQARAAFSGALYPFLRWHSAPAALAAVFQPGLYAPRCAGGVGVLAAGVPLLALALRRGAN